MYIYRRKIPTIKIVENWLYNSNNRAVINEFGVVRQVTNFYPFGGVFSTTAYNSGDDLQPYKYNGKELDRTHGLDWYDYGARNYDAIVPMFTSIDPLCEKYYHISPYAYCANNPILFVDPNGMDWLLITGDKVYWYEGNKGDKSSEPTIFNATSGGPENQMAKYQNMPNVGPTPEGDYHLDLGKPGSDRNAKTYKKEDGSRDYLKADEGIENMNFT